MAMINSQNSVPEVGDTVTSQDFSKDRRIVTVTFASGKQFTGHVDYLTDEERSEVHNVACSGSNK